MSFVNRQTFGCVAVVSIFLSACSASDVAEKTDEIAVETENQAQHDHAAQANHNHDHHDEKQVAHAHQAILADVPAMKASDLNKIDCSSTKGEDMSVGWTVTTTRQGEREPVSNSKDVKMWRSDERVLFTDVEAKLSETWMRYPNGIKLDRHFDEDERTIEYQPGDYDSDTNNWTARYQVVPDAFLSSQEPVSVEGEGCKRVETYAYEEGGVSMTLTWQPALRLLVRQDIERDGFAQTWTLTHAEHSAAKVEEAFNARQHYIETDYADIGDNETDPFFVKMINLGFIEHGASGFYDEHGNALQGEHSPH